MPKAKRVVSKKAVEPVVEPTQPTIVDSAPNFIEKHGSKLAIAFLALLVIGALVFKNKSLFVVALVDNQPITRIELENRMVSRYGQQVVDELVNEKIIRDAASKKGLTVTSSELDAKIAEISKVLEGKMTIDQALAQQGMTMEDFKSQLKMQILAEKIASAEVLVTDADIEKYITDNKTFMTATESAAQRTEALETLKRQKTAEAFQKMFTDLKSKANVTKFL